ncbi:MAG: AraC family transcriptional regulator [Cellvibrionaceae bacterium]|nr:AraC family transcriptional regulator [Cellvibrionaceae bacterium]
MRNIQENTVTALQKETGFLAVVPPMGVSVARGAHRFAIRFHCRRAGVEVIDKRDPMADFQSNKNTQSLAVQPTFSTGGFNESPQEQTERLLNKIESYDFQSFTDRLRFLHHQFTDPALNQDDLWKSYLLAGCKMFSMEQAGFYKVLNPSRPRSLAQSDGMPAMCETVENTEKWLEIVASELQNSEISAGNLITEQVTMDTGSGAPNGQAKRYFAASVKVGEKDFGVLLFLSPSTCEVEHSELDRETLKLMAEGVARMIELRNVQPAGGSLDLEHFATDGVSGLREYMERAALPQLYGIPNRVVEILVERIGTQPLGIDHIAETLNLSKRTLQRRLQQQDLCFADIRDQVRFHFAIEYLIRGQDSIDSISSSLDFSDRTSFTNAFKRWTGLSPSTFRKLFRDYA